MSRSEYRRVLPDVRFGATRALALVDPERLGVHAGELRGDADDVDGAILVALLFVDHRQLTSRSGSAARSRSPRPTAPRASSAPSTACGARRPRPSRAGRRDRPLLRRALAAHPERLAARGAGGHLQRDRAVQRRHLDVRAERGLGERDRHVDRQVVALATEQLVRCARARARRGRPGGRPRRPDSPLPASLIRAPSLTPAGTFTWIVRLRRVAPTPPQVGHGVSISRPVPRHCGHVCAIEKKPLVHRDLAGAAARRAGHRVGARAPRRSRGTSCTARGR